MSEKEKKSMPTKRTPAKPAVQQIISIALIGIGLAMGICTMVVAAFGQINLNNAAAMLGMGLSCVALYQLKWLLPKD